MQNNGGIFNSLFEAITSRISPTGGFLSKKVNAFSRFQKERCFFYPQSQCLVLAAKVIIKSGLSGSID